MHVYEKAQVKMCRNLRILDFENIESRHFRDAMGCPDTFMTNAIIEARFCWEVKLVSPVTTISCGGACIMETIGMLGLGQSVVDQGGGICSPGFL
jgi:hypothetical protein